MTTILVTGGVGYIGSHVCFELLEAGHKVIVIDSLENSDTDSIQKIESMLNKKILFYHSKVQDTEIMNKIFTENQIDGVIHMAGYKSVKQSVQDPNSYYENNLMSTIVLLKTMHEFNCHNMIFSSSATVYGEANGICKESNAVSTLNPYGETKLLIERILDYVIDYDKSKSLDEQTKSVQICLEEITKHTNLFTENDIITSDEINFISLRYFNPIGAHPSHQFGENPSNVPENLVPYIMKVLSGDLDSLTVFGNDYDTIDGTAVRDYIHVVDLAKAHVSALNYQISNNTINKHLRFNIGTGKGYSVLEIIKVFENLIDPDIKFNWKIGERRTGDAALIYADSTKANEILKWKPIYGIEQMCEDAWCYWKN